MTDSFRRGLAAAWCAAAVAVGALALGGCTTDGHATKAAHSAAAAAPSSAQARSSATLSAAAESSQSAPSVGSHSTESPSSADVSESSSSGVAARAWSMTCSDYQELTPDEKKQVTAEFGRRLNKKELREGDRSWAIVAASCSAGLVRDSQGVTDSQ
ncbi:MAG: hypothetical protein WAW85_16265 [Gordonia sp. (in: high G+C Gram-positive bacteria)]|uniref:hypothetical protein n=1 Tax=Gordonia sp. (in: high G+C Gram-positive bacteria) TaxID=84139 RepID=UPI003BB5D735